MRHLAATAAAAAAVAFVALQAQPSAIDAGNVAKELERELAAARVPGAAIAVVSGDQVSATAFGVTDASTGTAMTPATLMHLGSLTKLFTALAVSAALETREMAMTTAIGTVKPGLVPRAAAVTFHQALTHTAGLRDRPGEGGESDELALASSMRELTDRDFILPPDLVFSYSNLGYALAGAALEHLTRRGFNEALRDAALTPLGMERSTLRPSEAAVRGHAWGHRIEGNRVVKLESIANDTRIWPSGYLWSNATDVSRALGALLNGGRVAGQKGLPPAVVSRVLSPHTPMPNVFVGGHYGYGVMLARDRGVMIQEHGGTLPGFSSILRLAPERRFGIAVLTNLDNAPLRRIAQNVMAAAMGLSPAAPAAREEHAVSPAEISPLIGKYENRGVAVLASRDTQVTFSLDDGPPLPVARIGEDRYIARVKPGGPGPEFVLRPATATAPAYLHFALWAYVKE